ncbi:MAG TPA: AI-2E family transporter, partial [Longimicrobiales bacterium]|nr:AI-2E family transporter [Longimicrobiales bacterium]
MIFDRTEEHPGARFLFILACLVVVVYGVKFAAPILLPSSLALFLAILSLPVLIFLRHRKVPPGLAIAITVLLDVAVFGLVILLASQSVSELQERLPRYAATLQDLQAAWIVALEARLDIPI